jgi:carbamoyltransferase
MYTLGINAAYHDSAACLVRDGEVLAAAEDERFTRIKHGKRPIPFSTYELPFHAIDFCLQTANIDLCDVDHIAYSFDPFLLLGDRAGQETICLPLEPSAVPELSQWEHVWTPLFLSAIVNAPRQLPAGVPHHLEARFRNVAFDGPFQWHFVDHHVAHAASAYFPSPFEDAAVMTLDGRGEQATTTYSVGEGNSLQRIGQVDYPDSLGLLYERITTHLGFLHSSDEYKVMALASFGQPRLLDEFLAAINIGTNGHYRVALSTLEAALGAPRRRGGPLEQRHFDIARSLQAALELTVLSLADWLHEETGKRNLCMAGGVALNCVLNAVLRDAGPFDQIWVQPAAGDAGTALGAALWTDACRGGNPRAWRMNHAFLGSDYEEAEIEAFLDRAQLPYRRSDDIPGDTAALLAENKIVGWFQGRAEFGPRALGARSILASPIDPSMQKRLNELKDREDFRPVAPVVLEENAADWFCGAGRSPFMLFVYQVNPARMAQIPAVCHIDGTARIQTVNREQHALYYDLLRAFELRTGVPILVNTSFNTRSEPIVNSPRDAVECFWSSPIDALAIGPFILEKKAPAA